MRPFQREEGVLVPLDRSDVDTDQIIPKQFLKRIERNGYGEFLFNDWRRDPTGAPRPDFVLNQDGVQGGNGPRHRPQLRVRLVSRARGVGACRPRHSRGDLRVVRRHLQHQRPRQRARACAAARARGSCTDRPRDEQPGITVAVDLVTETVTCGDLRFGFHLDPFVRKRLLEGLDDISLTLEHEEAITAFEAQRPAWMPDLSRAGVSA